MANCRSLQFHIDTTLCLKHREYSYNQKTASKLINSKFYSAKDFYCKNLFAHYGCVNAIEFSNDGEWFISGGDDRRVLLWNVEKNIFSNKSPPIEMLGTHSSNIFCLAMDSTNSKIFSAGNDEQVIVHDTQTGTSIDIFPHHEAIYSIAVDPCDDDVFATACDDGKVFLWDTRQPFSDPIDLASSASSFHAVVYNPLDSRILATANSNDGIGLWDVRLPCSPLFKFASYVPCQSSMSVKFSSNGRYILSLMRRLPVGLFTLGNPYPVFEFDHEGYYNSCTMKSCCFAGENDQYVMSGSDDFNLYMWKIPEIVDYEKPTTLVSQAHMVFKGHRSIVNQVRYNSSRAIIASSGVEKLIKLWSPFPIPEFEKQSYNECKDSRQVYSQDEYIRMVLETGQYVTHDYSMQSTSEDPRMMAFFDSMVQRDIEGLSSPSSTCSSSSASSSFSSSLSSETEHEESNGRISPRTFSYVAQLTERVEDVLNGSNILDNQNQAKSSTKEKIANLICKKKYQQLIKAILQSFKSSKKKLKKSKKNGKLKESSEYSLIKRAKNLRSRLRNKKLSNTKKMPSYRRRPIYQITCLNYLIGELRDSSSSSNSNHAEEESNNRPIDFSLPTPDYFPLLSDSTRLNTSSDSSSDESTSSTSSSSQSSHHSPVSIKEKAHPKDYYKQDFTSNKCSFKRVSKLHNHRNYRSRSNHKRSKERNNLPEEKFSFHPLNGKEHVSGTSSDTSIKKEKTHNDSESLALQAPSKNSVPFNLNGSAKKRKIFSFDSSSDNDCDKAVSIPKAKPSNGLHSSPNKGNQSCTSPPPFKRFRRLRKKMKLTLSSDSTSDDDSFFNSQNLPKILEATTPSTTNMDNKHLHPLSPTQSCSTSTSHNGTITETKASTLPPKWAFLSKRIARNRKFRNSLLTLSSSSSEE